MTPVIGAEGLHGPGGACRTWFSYHTGSFRSAPSSYRHRGSTAAAGRTSERRVQGFDCGTGGGTGGGTGCGACPSAG